MRLKPTTRLLGLKPEMVVALLVAESVYHARGLDCVITSGIDGEHLRASKHYAGLAVDLRVHHVPVADRDALVADLRDALGPDYDVVWEAYGTPNEHVHLEHEPKAAY